MIAAVLLFAERLARLRRPYAKTLISSLAAAAILLSWNESLFSATGSIEPGRAAFELALLVVSFSCLHLVVLGVIESFATVWNRSSNLFIAIASYIFMGATVLGFDLFLYSNRFIRSDNDPWDWLNWTMAGGAVVTILFGLIVWLTAAVRELIDNYRKRKLVQV